MKTARRSESLLTLSLEKYVLFTANHLPSTSFSWTVGGSTLITLVQPSY
jgi:hypothetical protein